MVNNTERRIALRRAENTLMVVGLGIILFSAWSAVRTVGLVLLYRTKILTIIKESLGEMDDVPISDNTLFGILLAMVGIFLLFTIALRLFIGLSAMAEARGKRSGIFYILLTVFLIWVNIHFTIDTFLKVVATPAVDYELESPTFAGVFIELTSVVMMIEMVISAVRVRKYRKQERQEVSDAA